jgi:hypothetical protein
MRALFLDRDPGRVSRSPGRLRGDADAEHAGDPARHLPAGEADPGGRDLGLDLGDSSARPPPARDHRHGHTRRVVPRAHRTRGPLRLQLAVAVVHRDRRRARRGCRTCCSKPSPAPPTPRSYTACTPRWSSPRDWPSPARCRPARGTADGRGDREGRQARDQRSLAPKRSASRPPSSSRLPKPGVSAVTTHRRLLSERCSAFCAEGTWARSMLAAPARGPGTTSRARPWRGPCRAGSRSRARLCRTRETCGRDRGARSACATAPRPGVVGGRCSPPSCGRSS